MPKGTLPTKQLILTVQMIAMASPHGFHLTVPLKPELNKAIPVYDVIHIPQPIG
jgi:hypothetical protein